ncbi:MAG: Uma2 family endonuclease [candidate division KSB1 bacterium]|nr:Uma2 family endonuclease [candidate division KSB1 bacterium]
MSIQPKRRLTPEEYLEIERQAEYKSEYFNGEMFAFAGATREHNLIAGNIYSNLHQQLRKKTCEVYPSDMRVKVTATGLYTYPDVVIVCGKPQFEDEKEDILLNPIVIIEVLSPTTENYDRGIKFTHYRTISSLTDYILVAQDNIHVEHYVRQSDRSWLFSEYKSADEKIQIESIGCELLVAEIYEKVEFEGESKSSAKI